MKNHENIFIVGCNIFVMKLIFDKKKKNSSKLRYGMVHSLFGEDEGVPIVMKQLEEVLHKKMDVPENRIYYLVGQSKIKSKQITEAKVLWNNNPINVFVWKDNYSKNLKREDKLKLERAIELGKRVIETFVKKNKIDVLIAHNSSHPVNFVMCMALSRYFKGRKEKGLFAPRYILWWHDSHLERDSFSEPSQDIKKYLIEGLPGPNVDYILFINSLQWDNAKDFFREVDKKYPGFYERIERNHDFVFNTTNTFIRSFQDLENHKFGKLVHSFFRDYDIYDLLGKKGFFVEDVLFCLQPTRIVHRKRIDFALKFCYSLLRRIKEKGQYKAIYFLISGYDPIGMKDELIELDKKLKKKFKEENVFLIFAEDYVGMTNLNFLDYPKVFAQLNGIATYFSDVEGFGNNLLEVLASGLPPVIYEYPVYKKDISKSKLKLISFDKFKIDNKRLERVVSLLKNKTMRKNWVNKNLEILRRDYPHDLIVSRLKKAVYG